MPTESPKSRPLKIVADENVPKVEEIFSALGKVQLLPGRSLCAADVADADLLLVRSVTQVTSELLADSKVKFVGTATIGTDHVDQAYLQQVGIDFSNAPGCNAEAVVDYVFSGIYLMAERYGFDPREKTFGIVGVGNVGGRLAKRLNACGFKVLLNDPPRAEHEMGFVALEEIISTADFICVHTPLTLNGEHKTQHLFNGENLSRLQQGAFLLNAGRGAVIDNQALQKVGEQRHDLKFILDVWEHEPQVDRALAQRCELVSPHIAGYSLDGKIRGTFMLYQAYCQRLGLAADKNLVDFLPAAEGNTVDFDDVTQNKISIFALISQVYDPREDDRQLREILHLPAKEQSAAFDRLRKQYRRRRELSSLQVATNREAKLLAGIGFQLAEKRRIP